MQMSVNRTIALQAMICYEITPIVLGLKEICRAQQYARKENLSYAHPNPLLLFDTRAKGLKQQKKLRVGYPRTGVKHKRKQKIQVHEKWHPRS